MLSAHCVLLALQLGCCLASQAVWWSQASNRLHPLIADQAVCNYTVPLIQTAHDIFLTLCAEFQQVWKPLKGPVQESPLGMIDAETVDKADYMDLRLQFEARTGYNYALRHNPGVSCMLQE